MAGPSRALIADDHPPTRAGLALALELGGFEICAEVPDADAAVEAALLHRPDVCLLDVHMPGNGIAATARIKSALPECAVVIVTVSRNDSDLFDALRAGASGYLLKDMDPRRLPAALRGVLRGEAALPRALVAPVIDEFRERGRRRRLPLFERAAVDLTSREWEVLELLRQGLSTGEIAGRLFITQATVRSHVASVLRKLHVPSRKAALTLLERR